MLNDGDSILCYLVLYIYIYIYICKTQIYVQPLINIQSSNPEICPFSNSQIYGPFSLSQIDITDVCPNPNPNQ